MLLRKGLGPSAGFLLPLYQVVICGTFELLRYVGPISHLSYVAPEKRYVAIVPNCR